MSPAPTPQVIHFESMHGVEGTDATARAPRRLQIRGGDRVLFAFEFIGTHQNTLDLSKAIQACGSFRIQSTMELNFGPVPVVAGLPGPVGEPGPLGEPGRDTPSAPISDCPQVAQEGAVPEGPQG